MPNAPKSIGNILVLLPPYAYELMEPERVIEAAIDFKQAGASRADIATDPRLRPQSTGHVNASPVADFTRVAQRLSDTIFRPLVGQSDVRDFDFAIHPLANKIMPDLQSLSIVGNLFVKNSPSHAMDGRNLGLLFYIALHGRTQDNAPYNRLVFPAIKTKTRDILARIMGETPKDKGSAFGNDINLELLRARLAILHSGIAAAPTKTLN